MVIIFKVIFLTIIITDILYEMYSAGKEECFFPGRCADIFVWGEKVGSMGVIHPNTLKAFELPNPVSGLELNLEPFL